MTAMREPTLFDLPPAKDRPPHPFGDRRTIDERFEEFHVEHPEVFRMFSEFASQLLAAGHRRGSAEQIIQRIRWQTSMNPGRDGGFKINDHFRRRYAWMLAAADPRFGEFFEFRTLKGE